MAELCRRWRELTAAQAQRAERMDLLRFQVAELSELGLADGELDALDVEQRRLANLGSLQGTAAALVNGQARGRPGPAGLVLWC